MTQNEKSLLLKDLCARLPYGVKVLYDNHVKELQYIESVYNEVKLLDYTMNYTVGIDEIKPYLFPLTSMTEEEHAIYFKIWEDIGKMAYLEGCHHLIVTIRAYKAANDYLLSKHYDVNGLIPMGLANDATGLNIY